MNWTKTAPTKAGFYWHMTKTTPLEFVRVDSDNTAVLIGDNRSWPLRDFNVRVDRPTWLGPINEPNEETFWTRSSPIKPGVFWHKTYMKSPDVVSLVTAGDDLAARTLGHNRVRLLAEIVLDQSKWSRITIPCKTHPYDYEINWPFEPLIETPNQEQPELTPIRPIFSTT